MVADEEGEYSLTFVCHSLINAVANYYLVVLFYVSWDIDFD